MVSGEGASLLSTTNKPAPTEIVTRQGKVFWKTGAFLADRLVRIEALAHGDEPNALNKIAALCAEIREGFEAVGLDLRNSFQGKPITPANLPPFGRDYVVRPRCSNENCREGWDGGDQGGPCAWCRGTGFEPLGPP